jgi:hypothetical protein
MAEHADPVSVEAVSLDTADEATPPEQSDVSFLQETHTADTAPASPPALEDCPTSSPPPSDVFSRDAEPSPSEPAFAPPDTPSFGEPLARTSLLVARAEPPRPPYWEWALLGFCGTLLLVVIALRQGGVPPFSVGIARRPAVAVTALRPPPASPASPARSETPATALEQLAGAAPQEPPPAPASKADAPLRKRKGPTSKRRKGANMEALMPRAVIPAPVVPAPVAPAPASKRTPARDSVRAGLAQELP